MATGETRKSWMAMELTRSRNIEMEGQLFIGYTVAVKDLHEVN